MVTAASGPVGVTQKSTPAESGAASILRRSSTLSWLLGTTCRILNPAKLTRPSGGAASSSAETQGEAKASTKPTENNLADSIVQR